MEDYKYDMDSIFDLRDHESRSHDYRKEEWQKEHSEKNLTEREKRTQEHTDNKDFYDNRSSLVGQPQENTHPAP